MGEPVARLVAASVTFEPKTTSGYGTPIPLAYQQKVTLNRAPEKKELVSNDVTIGATAMELEIRVVYELNTEVGDASLDVLALAFKGIVITNSYSEGDVYWNGKTIKDELVAGVIGDVVLDGETLYIVKIAYSEGAFSPAMCSERTYAATQKELSPEKVSNTLGRIVVDGVNQATGRPQVLIIPMINLSFDGEFAISDAEYAKVSFKGKVLKKEGEPLFKLIDA